MAHTLSNTPKVLATLHDTPVLRRHVLSGADDGVGDRVRQDTGMLGGGLVIRVNGGLVDADALRLDDVPDLQTEGSASPLHKSRAVGTHPLLEQREVVLGKSISLRDDGDQVDPCAQALHDLNVEGLESVVRRRRLSTMERRVECYSRVTSRADEVQASMDAQVNLVMPLGLLLLPHIRFVLVVNEVDDG